jgi:shikimate kinase
MSSRVRQQVWEEARVVYLEATSDALKQRLSGDSERPLLDDGFPEALLAEREPIYRTAHHVVATSGRAVAEIASEVTDLVRDGEGG